MIFHDNKYAIVFRKQLPYLFWTTAYACVAYALCKQCNEKDTRNHTPNTTRFAIDSFLIVRIIFFLFAFFAWMPNEKVFFFVFFVHFRSVHNNYVRSDFLLFEFKPTNKAHIFMGFCCCWFFLLFGTIQGMTWSEERCLEAAASAYLSLLSFVFALRLQHPVG